jgi:nucleotide-binding universal stress UspA family protein
MTRVLVATDFSTRSDRALRRAVLIASEFEAKLTLVHVIDDDQPTHLVERQRAAAKELLDDTARTITSVDKVRTGAVITTGDAFAGILRIADEIDPDLIVVGPHRRQLLDMFIGTTAERTIRRSRFPVLMANSVPAGPYERTLLAIDFDDASRAAAQAVERSTFLNRSNVTAVHLFDAPAVGLMKRAMEGSDAIDHYVGQEAIGANAQFQSFLSAAGLIGVERMLRPHGGSPAKTLLSLADKHRADLVIVGTNQRRGFQRMLLGSVAQEILPDANCDVIVIPVESDAAALAA